MKKSIFVVLCLSVLFVANCQNKEKVSDKRTQEQEAMAMQRINEYERILEINPNDLEILTALGNVYYDVGRWDKAVENYLKVLAIDSTDVNVRTDMGTAYKQMGLYDLAEREFKKGIEIDPKHSKAHYNLGVVYHDQGKYKETLAEWEKSYDLEQDPYFKETAKRNIEQLKQMSGESTSLLPPAKR
ncbi:MAG: tetratricopeptide repeat protein [bacterium]